MNKSLFNITQEFKNLCAQLLDNSGELTPEIQQALKINQSELQAKSQGYVSIIKHIEMEEAAIDKEIKRLSDLKKNRVNAKERLKESLKSAMIHFDVTEIITETNKINFRHSESVEILSEDIIPKEYKKTKLTPEKSKIKKAIKEGRFVPGASLVENKNIQIK